MSRDVPLQYFCSDCGRWSKLAVRGVTVDHLRRYGEEWPCPCGEKMKLVSVAGQSWGDGWTNALGPIIDWPQKVERALERFAG